MRKRKLDLSPVNRPCERTTALYGRIQPEPCKDPLVERISVGQVRYIGNLHPSDPLIPAEGPKCHKARAVIQANILSDGVSPYETSGDMGRGGRAQIVPSRPRRAATFPLPLLY